MQLTADALERELFSEILTAEDQGFTLTKQLGTVESETDTEGNLLFQPASEARIQIEANAAAVRLLGERYPALTIKYPQTVISEKTVRKDDTEQHFAETRTDAVIDVPEHFVQVHSGAAFRQLMEAEWTEQLTELTNQIAKRLRRHEMRTARMFGSNPDFASAVFRVTEDTAASDIWTVVLSNCGFYPLQWDGEICGMAMLLAQRLKEALAEDCGSLLKISLRREPAQKSCIVALNYSIKQD